jgi:hypothetical protein
MARMFSGVKKPFIAFGKLIYSKEQESRRKGNWDSFFICT